MRKLSDTVARMRALHTTMGQTSAAPTASHLTELRDFGSNPGALRALTFVPENLPAGAPLVVVLHGCTQNATSYDVGSGWSRLAARSGFAVLFAEQQRANNPNLCFNWFEPGDTRRGAGEALSIHQMIQSLIATHDLDEKRVFITGLSAGGAMTSTMLATYPEVFAGGAIIAGLPHGSARSVPEAFDRMRGQGMSTPAQLRNLLRTASDHDGRWPTISIWHGSADRTVQFSNAEAIVAQWRAVHGVSAAATHTEVVDGHSRQVWRDAHDRDVIELFSLSAMAHGTPVASNGPSGLGTAGPFFIDAGISSTLHIARFWGLPVSATTETAAKEPKAPARPSVIEHDVIEHEARPSVPPVDIHPAAQMPPSRTAGVGKIIEDALRKAGLMR